MIKNKKLLFLLLTFVFSCLFLILSTEYQSVLTQGDHGRDLYAFNAVAQGEMPYKDFWWVYGPLMPYYFGSFMKILGTSISTVLLAKAILIVASGIFFYLALSLFASPLLSMLGALWFIGFRNTFFYTYNHAGGLLILTLILYLLFKHINERDQKLLKYLLLATTTLALIKINFGVISLVGLVLTVTSLEYKEKSKNNLKIFLAQALLLVPAVVISIYTFFLRGLPFYEIRQCLPYLSSDHPYTASLSGSLEKGLLDLAQSRFLQSFLNILLFPFHNEHLHYRKQNH
jgi:hypothetical protein